MSVWGYCSLLLGSVWYNVLLGLSSFGVIIGNLEAISGKGFSRYLLAGVTYLDVSFFCGSSVFDKDPIDFLDETFVKRGDPLYLNSTKLDSEFRLEKCFEGAGLNGVSGGTKLLISFFD
jgi:hypothetical protein